MRYSRQMTLIVVQALCTCGVLSIGAPHDQMTSISRQQPTMQTTAYHESSPSASHHNITVESASTPADHYDTKDVSSKTAQVSSPTGLHPISVSPSLQPKNIHNVFAQSDVSVAQQMISAAGYTTPAPYIVTPNNSQYFQVTTTLPSASELGQNTLDIRLAAGEGITIENATSSAVTIGDIPCSDITGCSVVSSNNQASTLEGGANTYWTVRLTAASITYLLQHGMNPTTSSAYGGTSQLTAGSQVGVMYAATLTSSTSNATLTAQASIVSPDGTVLQKSATSTITVEPLNTQISVSIPGNTSSSHPQAQKGAVFNYKIAVPLPNPNSANLTSQFYYYGIELKVGPGVEVLNVNASSTSTAGGNSSLGNPETGIRIGGFSYQELSKESGGMYVDGSSTNQVLTGGTSSYWRLDLTQSQISYIVSQGSDDGYATVLGQYFYIIVPAMLTTNVSRQNGATVTAIVGWDQPGSTSNSYTWLANNPCSDSVTVYPYPIDVLPTADVELLDKENEVSQGTHYIIPGTTQSIQVLTHVPNPSQMTGANSEYTITVSSSQGIQIPNGASWSTSDQQDSLSTKIQIAGLALKDFPSIQITGSPNGTGVMASDTSWTIHLNAADIHYLEQFGESPASTTYTAENTHGLAVNDLFAVTFPAILTSQAPDRGNSITAHTAYTSTDGTVSHQSADDSLYLEKSPVQPPEMSLHIIGSNGLIAPPPVSEDIFQTFTYQLRMTLPNPAEMTGAYSVYQIADYPQTDIELQNAAISQNWSSIKIAGIPLSTLKEKVGLGLSSTVTSAMIQGETDSNNSWTITLTPADIEYIEAHGVSPATATSPEGTTPGLKPGDPFALTIEGYIDDSLPIQSTIDGFPNTASASYASSESAQEYTITSGRKTVRVYADDMYPNIPDEPVQNSMNPAPTQPLDVRSLPMTGGHGLDQWLCAALGITSLGGVIAAAWYECKKKYHRDND